MLDKGKGKAKDPQPEALGNRGMLSFYLTLPAIGLMLPAIDLTRFPDPSPLHASSSTFRGCLMDGGQSRGNPTPIDDTAQASQGGSSFSSPAFNDCESQPKNDPIPIDDIAQASQGGSSLPLPAESDMFGSQLNGDPMLIEHALPTLNNESSFPSHAPPSTLNTPGLGCEAEAIPMSVDDAGPNCKGV